MRIDPVYRIEAATARDPVSRIFLAHVRVDTWDGQPVAVASDGYAIVVVPVALDEGDQLPALIPVVAIREARRRRLPLCLLPTGIAVGGEHLCPYPPETPYPDWKGIIEEALEIPGKWESLAVRPSHTLRGCNAVGVTVKLLRRVMDALGSDRMYLSPAMGHRALIISTERGVWAGTGRPVPPFALLMRAML